MVQGGNGMQTGARARSQTLSVQVKLREMILDGELSGGERLYEVPLAERLGVSRTPLRAALARLEQEGLLERRTTTGYVVRTFTLADALDAIELRGVLEGTAARLAAERGADPEGLDAMRALLARMDAALDRSPGALDLDDYMAANGEFHDRLPRLAGSEMIRREVERSTGFAFASPSAFLDSQREVESFRLSLYTAQAQHYALVEAIEGREGARAEAVAREHARLARRNLEYVVHQNPSLTHRVPGLALVSVDGRRR
jgi:GntR family transcriptional regulator, vanillate catabolism transcriptional regulator